MSNSAEIPELQCNHPDGTKKSRMEMDQWLRKEVPKVHWLRIIACRTLGLPKQASWAMPEIVLRHWFLDELLRRQAITGDLLGVSATAFSDENELRQFTQRLTALIQAGHAVQPQHAEGVDMNGYTPPPPPVMGGVPQQNGQNGQQAYPPGPPQPPGPPGVPMGPPQQQYAQPPQPPGPPGPPQQYAQPPQPPGPPGPPMQQQSYAPPPGVPMQPQPPMSGPPQPPAPIGPPGAPPQQAGGRGGRKAKQDGASQGAPPAAPVPPMGPPGAPQGNFAPQGFQPAPVGAPQGFVPPAPNGAPQMQFPQQPQMQQPQQQAPQGPDLSGLNQKLDQLLTLVGQQAQRIAELEKKIELNSMANTILCRAVYQRQGSADVKGFLTELGIQFPQ